MVFKSVMRELTLNFIILLDFEIPVPRNTKPFEVGFDFKTEGNLKSETTWIEVDEQRVFVEKSAH